MPPSPDAATTFTDEASALIAQGRFDDAVVRARRACSQPVADARAWRTLAAAFEGQGDWTSAFGAYGQALARASDDPDVIGPMARLALKLGNFQAAEALLAIHETLATPTLDDIANLALARTRIRDFDTAQDGLRSALEADPGAADTAPGSGGAD